MGGATVVVVVMVLVGFLWHFGLRFNEGGNAKWKNDKRERQVKPSFRWESIESDPIDFSKRRLSCFVRCG